MDADIIRELMTAYDSKKLECVEKFGSAVGFDQWFTRQVMG